MERARFTGKTAWVLLACSEDAHFRTPAGCWFHRQDARDSFKAWWLANNPGAVYSEAYADEGVVKCPEDDTCMFGRVGVPR